MSYFIGLGSIFWWKNGIVCQNWIREPLILGVQYRKSGQISPNMAEFSILYHQDQGFPLSNFNKLYHLFIIKSSPIQWNNSFFKMETPKNRCMSIRVPPLILRKIDIKWTHTQYRYTFELITGQNIKGITRWWTTLSVHNRY